MKAVRFEGWRDYYDNIVRKVHLNLSGKAGEDVLGGFGLLDLYGPTFYPGDKKSPAERYGWAKIHLEQKVAHPKFRQHFAVHEVEAWLLSEPRCFPAGIRAALAGKCSQPESVDFDEPPAELLRRLYREKLERRYMKVIDGSNLFGDLEPDAATQKCPHLKALLEDMLAVARGEFG